MTDDDEDEQSRREMPGGETRREAEIRARRARREVTLKEIAAAMCPDDPERQASWREAMHRFIEEQRPEAEATWGSELAKEMERCQAEPEPAVTAGASARRGRREEIAAVMWPDDPEKQARWLAAVPRYIEEQRPEAALERAPAPAVDPRERAPLSPDERKRWFRFGWSMATNAIRASLEDIAVQPTQEEREHALVDSGLGRELEAADGGKVFLKAIEGQFSSITQMLADKISAGAIPSTSRQRVAVDLLKLALEHGLEAAEGGEPGVSGAKN